MKIAVVGSGISGLSTAWLLSSEHEVTCYEKNEYFGGHSNTVAVEYQDKKIAVDTGFIVFNQQNYPQLTAMFKYLDVETNASNMSFSTSVNEGEFEYSGASLIALFSQPRNLIRLGFWRMLFDIIRFNLTAKKIIARSSKSEESEEDSLTIGRLIKNHKFGEYFRKYYLMPMTAAIWSCPVELAKIYPASQLIKFFDNHRLLNIFRQFKWRTVAGGSKNYVEKIVKIISDRPNCKILKNRNVIDIINKDDGKILLITSDGVNSYEELFDKVVFASNTEEVESILEYSHPKISKVFSGFSFQRNIAVLHRDVSVMPKRRKAWASWNFKGVYRESSAVSTSFTYWMNNLQNIDNNYPLFVTLNPIESIDQDKIFAQFEYYHPLYNYQSIKTQQEIEKLQGKDSFYYCGAYLGNGFHEDGLVSAIKIAKYFNVQIPWQES
jgi:predicted NAD/FAD-binding protein